MTPKPFGLVAWSRVKKRHAKKIINRGNKKYAREMFKRFYEFHGKKVGDLISGCDGLNSKVEEVQPIYIYTRRGKVLYDIDFIATSGLCCSMYNCGVGLPITYEQAVKYREETIKRYENNDEWGFAERYSKYIIQPDGTYLRE